MRLTEKDLSRIVKRVVRENEEENIANLTFNSEFDWVESEINPAEEFIYNKFKECKLEPAKSEKWLGYTKYVNETGEILFVDDIDTGSENPQLWFDYEKIYLKLEEMGLNYGEMKKLCIDMLYETHKRKVSTVWDLRFQYQHWLYETHKRKVSASHPLGTLTCVVVV